MKSILLAVLFLGLFGAGNLYAGCGASSSISAALDQCGAAGFKTANCTKSEGGIWTCEGTSNGSTSRPSRYLDASQVPQSSKTCLGFVLDSELWMLGMRWCEDLTCAENE